MLNKILAQVNQSQLKSKIYLKSFQMVGIFTLSRKTPQTLDIVYVNR